jgi:hypothetical protein
MNESKEINEIRTIFQSTQAVSERDSTAAASGRVNFLKQAESLKPAVSPLPKRRHNEWLEKIFIKERVKMFATILVIISLLLGGSGGAVYASQASIPNDLLYPVKTWSEQVQAQFADGPEQQYQLMLRFADQRVAEL